MNHKTKLILSVLAVFVITTMSCKLTDLVSNIKGGDSDTSLYQSASGGFEFLPLEDYEFSDSWGIIQMIAPGADPQAGPVILLVGGSNEMEMTLDDLADSMMQNTPDGEFSKPKKIKVDGINGYDYTVKSTYDGEEIEGRMVFVMVSPTQQFALVGAAPEGEWKSVNKDFETVLDSVRFFDAEPYSAYDEPGTSNTYTPELELDENGMLTQWAVSAVASSEYGSTDWSAMQATGEPNVDVCEDNTLAWASESATSVEWLELTYATAVLPYEITIVQSYNPSQVVEVTGITESGDEYLIFEAEPEYVDYCPDFWTITIEPDKEVYIKTLRLTVDQTVLGLGWGEIDAVQMVGVPQQGFTSQPSGPAEQSSSVGGNSSMGAEGNIPDGKGFLATKKYQAYLDIPINEIADLEKIIGSLKSSSGQLKPRPDHKDTFVFDIGENMQGYVSITTSGLIYKKNIGVVLPVDMKIDYDKSTYDELVQMQKDYNYLLPYSIVAEKLGSPGMIIWDQIREDGTTRIEYVWYNKNSDQMFVSSYDGFITGSGGISFIPASN